MPAVRFALVGPRDDKLVALPSAAVAVLRQTAARLPAVAHPSADENLDFIAGKIAALVPIFAVRRGAVAHTQLPQEFVLGAQFYAGATRLRLPDGDSGYSRFSIRLADLHQAIAALRAGP